MGPLVRKTTMNSSHGMRDKWPPNGLRTDLLRPQAQSRCATATNQHDGQITKNLSSPSAKIFRLTREQIIGITPPVSRRMRGVGHRHERAVRCDGRESCD